MHKHIHIHTHTYRHTYTYTYTCKISNFNWACTAVRSHLVSGPPRPHLGNYCLFLRHGTPCSLRSGGVPVVPVRNTTNGMCWHVGRVCPAGPWPAGVLLKQKCILTLEPVHKFVWSTEASGPQACSRY